MGKKYDLTGMRFGRLYVNGRSQNIKPRNVLWECQCDCGAIVDVTGSSLKMGYTQSCGCLRKEKSSNKPQDHHLSKTRLYVIWRNMKYRCYNKGYVNFSVFTEFCKIILIDLKGENKRCLNVQNAVTICGANIVN